jgi:hypothetical protein
MSNACMYINHVHQAGILHYIARHMLHATVLHVRIHILKR